MVNSEAFLFYVSVLQAIRPAAAYKRLRKTVKVIYIRQSNLYKTSKPIRTF